jgi:hypothetical protein
MVGLAGAAIVAITMGSGAGAPLQAVDPEVCGPYADLRAMLAAQFGERPASSRRAGDGTVIELFASASADTWTMVNVQPDGRACVVAVGQDWRALHASLQGQPV